MINNNKIYNNIDNVNLKKVMTTLHSSTYNYTNGQTIAYQLTNRDIIGIIEQGNATVIRVGYDGEKSLVDNLTTGDVFLSRFYSSINSEIIVVSIKKTTVTFIEYEELLKKSQTSTNAYILLNNILNVINTMIENKNERINLLTTKTIRNKLLSYFSMLSRQYNSKSFNLQISYTDLADYLGIDRSALMREFKNLKDEGIIKEINKKITILTESSKK